MDYQALYTELSTDPLSRGYASMSALEAANDLNTVYRTRQLTTMSGAQIYEQVDITEFGNLTDVQRQEVWDIVHLGEAINVAAGSKARTRFIALFGAGSDTITALAAELTEDISRAAELGLGIVTQGDVEAARALGG